MILVLGGGISGLSVAYQLQKQNKDFLLIEQDSEVGGKIKSHQSDGFTIERGPNTVLINNKEIKDLIEDLRLGSKIIKPNPKAIKNRFVLYNNQIVPLPTSPLTLLKSPLIGWYSFIKILKEPFVSKFESEESLADFSRRRLGNELYENFIYPFVTGIYAGNPERMSINYTLKILKELESKHGSIIRGLPKMIKANKSKAESENLPKEKIFTFKNGLQELPKSIAKAFEKKLSLSTEILAIEKNDACYNVTLKRNQEEIITKEVSHIISTIPFNNLKTCLDSAMYNSSFLNELDYVPAFVYHFGFKKGTLSIPNESFGLLSREKENVPFLGVLFNSQFFPHTAPIGSELITVITGGSKLRSLINETEKDRRDKILKSLNKLFRIKTPPVFENATSWNEAIPQYNLGHQKVIDGIKEFERKNKGFYILGNFKDGISVSDCISNGISFVKHHFN